jgi:hypothetical protein
MMLTLGYTLHGRLVARRYRFDLRCRFRLSVGGSRCGTCGPGHSDVLTERHALAHLLVVGIALALLATPSRVCAQPSTYQYDFEDGIVDWKPDPAWTQAQWPGGRGA